MSDKASAAAKVHEFPEPDTFKFGAAQFDIDVIDTCYVFDGILDDLKTECENAEPRREPGQKEYLYRLIGWLEKEKSVTLTLGQMEWLLGQMRLLDGRKKKAMRDDIESSWK